MEEQVALPYLSSRYTKITFVAEFTEDTELVREKASALRGGMGEMLLRAHCINNRDCSGCGFESECMVQRTMYSKFENRPASLNAGDSIGYIVDCADKRECFTKGDLMEFSLYLFGRTIVYFSQFLNAFYALGQNGLGKNKSRFVIVSVKNLFGQPVLNGSDVFMERYKWQTLGDYVAYRKKQLSQNGMENKLVFKTPACIKHKGEFIKEFSADALAASIERRLYILSCFEGNSVETRLIPEEPFPSVIRQDIKFKSTERYSSRRDEHMKLRGIYGEVWLEDIPESWLRYILAAEAARIGKNTSFGFGKLEVM